MVVIESGDLSIVILEAFVGQRTSSGHSTLAVKSSTARSSKLLSALMDSYYRFSVGVKAILTILPYIKIRKQIGGLRQYKTATKGSTMSSAI